VFDKTILSACFHKHNGFFPFFAGGFTGMFSGARKSLHGRRGKKSAQGPRASKKFTGSGLSGA
jgi:hypothetical protein